MKPLCRQDSNPKVNQLLASLTSAEWVRWIPYLELVDLPLGMLLSESGRAPGYAYFPTTAIVSLVYVTQDGESSEIALVGRDGMVGVALVTGGNASLGQAMVQSAGQAYRLQAQVVKEEVARAGPALMRMLAYTQALMAQVAQTAACNRYNSVEQLLCRRLVMGLDRLPTEAMVMTQELLASLLGVRREGVTAVALRLQEAGLIRYRRGHIDVLDRKGLELRMGEQARASDKPKVCRGSRQSGNGYRSANEVAAVGVLGPIRTARSRPTQATLSYMQVDPRPTTILIASI